VSGGRGAQTSVSVLDPTMWIERTDSEKNPEFKIVAYFQLQVKIHAFDKGSVRMVLQKKQGPADRHRYRKKNDKLFDFVSVRYLYHGCDTCYEKHTVKPHASDDFPGVKENEETKISTSVDLKLAKDSPVAVHVGRDDTLTYERNSESWHKGLSFESCKSDLILMTTYTYKNEMCQFPTRNRVG